MRILSLSVVIITLLAAVSASGQSAQTQVTFTKDVAPIFQARCQICHHPGTFAPMSLMTYEEARPWARSIKEKVLMREMPPWHLDKNVGVQYFSNDISLTDEQIATIVKWVDAGAVKGNPADMPPTRKFDDNETWQIGEPDRVITLPKDVIVKAKAPDQWPDILVDPGLTEDRYLKGVQIIPVKGFPVIHHIRTSLVEPAAETLHSGKLDDTDGTLEVGEMGVFLNEYAIGKKGDVFPEGSGRLVKAGTKINFQFHLHSVGTETPTNVALGLKFYPKGYVPKHVISSTTVSVAEIDLRPNTDNVRSDGYLTLVKSARLLSFQPHMHNRGKAECLEAIYPTAKLKCCPALSSTSIGISITSTAMTRRPCSRKGLFCIRSRGTTTPPGTSSTQILTRKSRGDSERLMKWAPRGSVGTTCPNRITKKRSKREKPHSGS